MHISVPLRSALAVALATFGLGGVVGATSAAYASGATYTWVGNSGNSGGDNHSWTDQKNWSPAGVPGDGDSVRVDAPDANHCTVNVDNVPSVTLTSLTLTATGCNTSITGGSITVTGAFVWDGGTLNTPLTVAGTGTISGTNSHLNTLSQDLTVAGTLTLSGVVDSGASNQGGLRIINPTHLHVAPGGTLASAGPNAVNFISCCNNPARIVNDGTISTSGGDLTVHAVAIDQDGTVSTASGANLVLDGAPATAADGASYSGAGRWVVKNGGHLTLSGTQHLGDGFRLTLGDGQTGATLDGTATLSGAGGVDWAGGTIRGDLTIAHGTTLGASGTTTNNGKRFLSGSDSAGGPTLTNHGSIAFSDGATMSTGFLPELVNASDGVLSLAPGTTFSSQGCCLNPDKVINDGGQVTVPAGSSTDPVTLSGVAYRATGGTTSIAAGRSFVFTADHSLLDSTSVSGGGTLGVAGQTDVSGTTTVGSGTTLGLVYGGTLDGTATVGGSGRMTWTGGSISGTVALRTAGGVAVSNDDAAHPKNISNVGGGSAPSRVSVSVPLTLTAGTDTHRDTIDVDWASTLALSGTTTLAANADIAGGTLRNSGRLAVAAGSGTAFRDGDATFVNSGDVTVRSGHFSIGGDYRQTAGHTTLSAGTHLDLPYDSDTIAIAGGTLDGSGTIRGGVDNTGGTVRPGGPSTGTLHLTGGYDQGRHAALALDVSSRAHDQLVVAGSAGFSGVVRATDLGSYRPGVGHKVGVARAGSLSTGTLCVATAGRSASTGHWAATHTGTALSLVWRKGRAAAC